MLNIYLYIIVYDWRFLEVLLRIVFEDYIVDIVENYYKVEEMLCIL